jgi:protein-disulfide isomerase
VPDANPPKAGTLTVPVGEADHLLGPALAGAAVPGVVDLLEYGDFQCPHCRRAVAVITHLRAERPLMAIAAELGLDVERLAMELSNGVHAPRVQRDISSGARSGVNGTPTFFINGKRYDGPYDLDLLRAAIDAAAGG